MVHTIIDGDPSDNDWLLAERFHGHLGPWLALGMRIGREAVTMLNPAPHFGLHVRVTCPLRTPYSCILDGLQLATGATYGKRNIEAEDEGDSSFSVTAENRKTGQSIDFHIDPATPDRFKAWLEQSDEGAVARRVWKEPGSFGQPKRAKGLKQMAVDEANKKAVGGSDTARDIAIAGCLLGAAIAVPIVFHLAGLGQLFLPMHIPVLIAGLILRPRLAAAVGGLAPIASMLITGMPPYPFSVIMVVELLVLSLTASILSLSPRIPIWIAAIVAICARCVATLLVTLALAPLLQLPAAAAGFAAVVSGAPGIALQFIAAVPAALWLRKIRSARVSTWT